MRYASVGGLVACLAVAAGVLSGGGPAQASLLKALKKQEKAKSYRAVQKVQMPDAPGGITADPEAKIFYSNGKTRIEGGHGVYTIFDPAAQTSTMVDPSQKRVMTQKMFADPVNTNAYAVMAESARKLIAAGAQMEDLGVQVEGKRRLKGYRFKTAVLDGVQCSVTFWLDAKDDTLVRFESVLPSPEFLVPTGVFGPGPEFKAVTEKRKPVPVTTVVEYIAFGEELDPKLFDATPPAGYKVETLEPTDGKPVPAAPPAPAKPRE